MKMLVIAVFLTGCAGQLAPEAEPAPTCLNSGPVSGRYSERWVKTSGFEGCPKILEGTRVIVRSGTHGLPLTARGVTAQEADCTWSSSYVSRADISGSIYAEESIRWDASGRRAVGVVKAAIIWADLTCEATYDVEIQ